MELISAAGITFMLALILLHYNELPTLIPRHYNANGQPDGFGDKSIIFSLPIAAILVYVLLSLALRFPQLTNYPVTKSKENAERQYDNVQLMLRVLKTLIVLIFCYLTYATIQNGLGKMMGLGMLFLPLVILSLLVCITFFIYRGYKVS